MALTSIGYDGTVDELGFAQLMMLAGNRYTVRDRAAFAATQVVGQRAVSLSAGMLYGTGVRTISDSAIRVDLPAPGANAGAWHLIALRRNWETNTQSIVALTDATFNTSATTPLTFPTTYPSGYLNNPGTSDDLPLYWAWVNSSNITVLLIDLRVVAGGKRGTPAERDAFYGTINTATVAGRTYLQNERWHNTVTGHTEVYMAEYAAGTNPSGARNVTGILINGQQAVYGWFAVGGGRDFLTATNFSGSLEVAPGTSALIDTITLTLDFGMYIELLAQGEWLGRGNVASTVQLLINKAILPTPYVMRTHSQGLNMIGRYDFPPLKMWLPAGVHTFEVYSKPDSASSVNWVKIWSKSVVTQAS
jgi:hypothetical protein